MEENTQKEVKLVPAICTKCGGQLEVDPTQEAAVCKYCGTAFIVDKAIEQYTVQHAKIEHVDTVNVDLKGSVDSVLDFLGKERAESREDKRERRRMDAENQKEFMKNSWKLFAIMFAAMVVLFVLGNLFHFFN